MTVNIQREWLMKGSGIAYLLFRSMPIPPLTVRGADEKLRDRFVEPRGESMPDVADAFLSQLLLARALTRFRSLACGHRASNRGA